MANLPITETLKKLNLSQERTRDWLSSLEDDDLESIAESSIVDSEYAYSTEQGDDNDDDDDNYDDREEQVTTLALGTQINPNKVTEISDSLRDLMNSINSVQTVGNVNISNSTNVHIGNVTNINGNIQIISDSLLHDRNNGRYKNRRRKQSPPPTPPATSTATATCEGNTNDCEEERVSSDVFIKSQKFKIPDELCSILPRHSWLAQMPMELPQPLELPVKYVVILHTATESSVKRAINIRLIRDIQCFHIESREWNDIAYNFLIGCDGNIYEGRGWRTIGAHTLGYNKIALGIAFIGCFMRELPTASALRMCRNLLAKGVEDGYIAPDYRLICHCQCNSTESPGRRLYEEIQTWPHFYTIEQEAEQQPQPQQQQ